MNTQMGTKKGERHAAALRLLGVVAQRTRMRGPDTAAATSGREPDGQRLTSAHAIRTCPNSRRCLRDNLAGHPALGRSGKRILGSSPPSGQTEELAHARQQLDTFFARKSAVGRSEVFYIH